MCARREGKRGEGLYGEENKATSYRMIEDFQGQGAGTTHLQAEERETSAHGCQPSVLNSYSFQAPGYYQKLRDGSLLSLKTIHVITTTFLCGNGECGYTARRISGEFSDNILPYRFLLKEETSKNLSLYIHRFDIYS